MPLGDKLNIFEAWLLSPPPLQSRQVNKWHFHIFIYSEDVTPSPGCLKGWRIFEMTVVALRPNTVSRTRIQDI